jgi:nucleoside-diphosphate-sugar epimerase
MSTVPKAFAGKRILITGASGFLGRHLTSALSESTAATLTLVSRRALSEQCGNARHVSLDLLDRDATFRFLRNNRFDIVYNLAGKIDQSIRPGVFDEQFSVHVQTTINLTDALIGQPIERFIHFGSSMEYGNAPYPQVNRERENPLSAYGVSKLASSKIVLARCLSEQLPGVVLRPFLIYGEGQGERSFLQSAIVAARNGSEFKTTEGHQTRDFTPVSKFVEDTLAISVLSDSCTVGEVFNICTGVEIYIHEVLETLQALYPNFRPQPGSLPYRSSEVMHSVGHPFNPWSSHQCWTALKDFLSEPA